MSQDPLESSWRKHMNIGQWVPDVSVDNCMVCKCEFSFWVRKHHCRRCGAIVCDSCSLNRTRQIEKEIVRKYKDINYDDLVRVCDLCILVIDRKLSDGLKKKLGVKQTNITGHDTVSSTTPQLSDMTRKPSAGGRTVITVGRYRAEIKESEGNRYIQDHDL